MKINGDRLDLREGVYWYAPRKGDKPVILVPPQLRAELIEGVHEMAHLGAVRCIRELRRSCFWPGMYADVRGYIAGCHECLQHKKFTHKPYPAQHIVCTNRWRILHIDLVGPLPMSHKKNTMILTMIDRYSRWVKLMTLDQFFSDCNIWIPSIVIKLEMKCLPISIFTVSVK